MHQLAALKQPKNPFASGRSRWARRLWAGSLSATPRFWDSYPGYALTAAVDGLLADFAAMQENCPEVVNPSGGEDRPDEGAYYAGVEEFLDRIAAKNDGGLPAHMAEDAEL